jgi:hypothetical protein
LKKKCALTEGESRTKGRAVRAEGSERSEKRRKDEDGEAEARKSKRKTKGDGESEVRKGKRREDVGKAEEEWRERMEMRVEGLEVMMRRVMGRVEMIWEKMNETDGSDGDDTEKDEEMAVEEEEGGVGKVGSGSGAGRTSEAEVAADVVMEE